MAGDAAQSKPINNFTDLKARLEAIDRNGQRALAARCSLMSLPHVLDQLYAFERVPQRGLGALRAFRASLVSGVFAYYENQPITDTLRASLRVLVSEAETTAKQWKKESQANFDKHLSSMDETDEYSVGPNMPEVYALEASAAAASVLLAVNDPIDATLSCCGKFVQAVIDSAVYSARGGRPEEASNSAVASIGFEIGLLDQQIDITQFMEVAPWSNGDLPQQTSSQLNRLFNQDDNHEVFGFWVSWLRGFHLGHPLDWELQRRVALGVADEVWDAGVEAVAKRIAEIEEEYLRETTHVVEDSSDPTEESARHSNKLPKLILSRVNIIPPLVENAEGEKLGLAKDTGPLIDPVNFALKNIRMALDHALEHCGENGFDVSSDEAAILRLALDTAPKEPRYIAGPFHHAHCLFERKFENTEYPRHGALEFLNNQLKAHVVGFVEADQSIADHIKSYGTLPEPDPVSQDTVNDLQEAGKRLEPVVDADARAVIDEVAKQIEPGVPPPKYAWAVLVQWFAQVWLYLDKLKKQHGLADWLWDLLKALFKSGGQ